MALKPLKFDRATGFFPAKRFDPSKGTVVFVTGSDPIVFYVFLEKLPFHKLTTPVLTKIPAVTEYQIIYTFHYFLTKLFPSIPKGKVFFYSDLILSYRSLQRIFAQVLDKEDYEEDLQRYGIPYTDNVGRIIKNTYSILMSNPGRFGLLPFGHSLMELYFKISSENPTFDVCNKVLKLTDVTDYSRVS